MRKVKTPSKQEKTLKVDQEEISSNGSEKLLGLVGNQLLTLNNHLYGNKKETGLLRPLSNRVGILSQLRRFTKPEKYLCCMNSIFMSKLLYRIMA